MNFWDDAKIFLSFFSCATCREGELYLLVDDLHGDEVVLLVEAAVVEQQTVGLPGRKTGEMK